jgi:hypothetical protein
MGKKEKGTSSIKLESSVKGLWNDEKRGEERLSGLRIFTIEWIPQPARLNYWLFSELRASPNDTTEAE